MADDPLVADLVGRLRSRGAEVWDHYDDVIDIVATVQPVRGCGPGGAHGHRVRRDRTLPEHERA